MRPLDLPKFYLKLYDEDFSGMSSRWSSNNCSSTMVNYSDVCDICKKGPAKHKEKVFFESYHDAIKNKHDF